jgi:hypothetical protein
MRWFNSNFHREDAKNAKKAVGELVDFLFPWRSWRLGGEPLNLVDLLLARGLVLVGVALAHVLAPGGSTPIFTAKTPRTPRKRWVSLLISSSLRALGVFAVRNGTRSICFERAIVLVRIVRPQTTIIVG